jgi:hypothetical protein
MVTLSRHVRSAMTAGCQRADRDAGRPFRPAGGDETAVATGDGRRGARVWESGRTSKSSTLSWCDSPRPAPLGLGLHATSVSMRTGRWIDARRRSVPANRPVRRAEVSRPLFNCSRISLTWPDVSCTHALPRASSDVSRTVPSLPGGRRTCSMDWPSALGWPPNGTESVDLRDHLVYHAIMQSALPQFPSLTLEHCTKTETRN